MRHAFDLVCALTFDAEILLCLILGLLHTRQLLLYYEWDGGHILQIAEFYIDQQIRVEDRFALLSRVLFFRHLRALFVLLARALSKMNACCLVV